MENALPRPRDMRSSAFQRVVDRLHDLITGHEMPDIPTTAPTGRRGMEPLPNVSPNEIVGLLEYLDSRGGREDVFTIASDLDREFGKIITAAKAAEMMDFVDTPKSIVELSPEGQRFVKAPAKERRVLWREQALKLQLFREIHEILQRQPEHTVTADFVQETIVMRMPGENYKRTFGTFVSWARFGKIFAYTAATGVLSLQPSNNEAVGRDSKFTISP
jgi:NitT/TauT family transport system ATP-binding protein